MNKPYFTRVVERGGKRKRREREGGGRERGRERESEREMTRGRSGIREKR